MLNFKVRVDLDLRPLNKRWEAKRKRVLYRGAGYALRVMRNRIKSAKRKTSAAGEAPKSKTRALKKNSRFEVDAAAGVARVGFTRFPSRSAQPLGGQTVPQTINRGGRERLRIAARVVTRPDGRTQTLAPQTVTAAYRPRPIVDPVVRPATEKVRELVREVGL